MISYETRFLEARLHTSWTRRNGTNKIKKMADKQANRVEFSEIKNKLRRSSLYQKDKLRKAKEKKERKRKRKREESQDPNGVSCGYRCKHTCEIKVLILGKV